MFCVQVALVQSYLQKEVQMFHPAKKVRTWNYNDSQINYSNNHVKNAENMENEIFSFRTNKKKKTVLNFLCYWVWTKANSKMWKVKCASQKFCFVCKRFPNKNRYKTKLNSTKSKKARIFAKGVLRCFARKDKKCPEEERVKAPQSGLDPHWFHWFPCIGQASKLKIWNKFSLFSFRQMIPSTNQLKGDW